MNKCLSIVSAVLLTVGCEKSENRTEDELATKLFYEQSHRMHLGLKDAVKEVREYKIELASNPIQNDSVLIAVYTFNEKGNLIAYAPSGEQKEAQTYWIPMDLESYEYDYDAQNRLVQVRKITNYTEPVVYTLTYGNHSTYLPLPFELKPIGQWLVKGLVSIESSELHYSFDGEKLIFEKEERGMIESEEVTFENNYPVFTSNIIRYEGEELRKIETKWQFSQQDGSPAYKEQYITEEEQTAKTIIRYTPEGLLREVVNCVEPASGLTYTHNSHRWLLNIKSDLGGEQTRLYEIDSHQNWIRCEQQTTGFVDWQYPEGKETIIREICY